MWRNYGEYFKRFHYALALVDFKKDMRIFCQFYKQLSYPVQFAAYIVVCRVHCFRYFMPVTGGHNVICIYSGVGLAGEQPILS